MSLSIGLDLWLMQDDILLHFNLVARKYLEDKFSYNSIGGGGLKVLIYEGICTEEQTTSRLSRKEVFMN